MKRILSLLLALTLVFVLVACSNEKDTTSEPDTSTTKTETESTDTNDTQTSETHTDESSSDTETPSSSTSTPTTSTETSKPTTSSMNNNASSTPSTSKPSSSTTTPSTSTPSTSTPSTPSHTHSWGSWKTETKALIGKDGIEKRTCSSCKETESRVTTNEATYNSFYDEAIKYFLSSNHFNDGYSKYISYFSQEYEGREEEIISPSSTTVFNWLSSRFVLTDSLKAEMKQDYRYDNTTDTFTLPYENSASSPYLLGYVHNGGNKYTVYYQHWQEKTDIIKVELEYNLLNGKPNKYLLIEKVDSVPNNIIK